MKPASQLIPKPNVTIGEICATNQPSIFQTVLGSCVSACLFDPVKKVAGINHILLDSDPNLSPGPRNVDFVLKYLNIESIPVISQNTGGTFTRRIFFHTDNFDVFFKKIQARSLKQIKKPSDILMFE